LRDRGVVIASLTQDLLAVLAKRRGLARDGFLYAGDEKRTIDGEQRVVLEGAQNAGLEHLRVARDLAHLRDRFEDEAVLGKQRSPFSAVAGREGLVEDRYQFGRMRGARGPA